MPHGGTDALAVRVAARYRGSGRFAAGYVEGKLRHDPLAPALLALAGRSADGPGFGAVVDLGCGRGQFAALLLEAGLARSVLGLERSPALLSQAVRAMAAAPALAFEGRPRDLAADPSVPPADTVLILDVLYQLPTEAQERLLDAAAAAARARVLVRAADPAAGGRAWATALLERAGRRVWPHAGDRVNVRPIPWVARRLERAGLRVLVAPSRAGTPFGNVLLSATREEAAAPP